MTTRQAVLGLITALVLVACENPAFNPQTFTISYNANEATGGMVPPEQVKFQGLTLQLATNIGSLVRIGYEFQGWDSKADGGGTAYAEGADYKIDSDATLYAAWLALPTYMVTYLPNGATGGSVPPAQTKIQGISLTLARNSGDLTFTGKAFLGWNTQADGSGISYTAGGTFVGNENMTLHAQWGTSRSFWTLRTTDNTYYSCDAILTATGEHCIVYVEATTAVSPDTDTNIDIAVTIAAEFDTRIYLQIQDAFGVESDVDSNGKIILLLLDIIDGSSADSSYLAGYFDPTHLYDFSLTTNPHSNESDMLFLDTNPAVAGDADFYGTIAHEFQHLINYNNTVLAEKPSQDTWINEGLSSGAEYIYAGDQIQWKIDYFNEDPLETIAHGNNFFVWNGYRESDLGGNDVLADYASVYLFFQWLRIHASTDTDNGTLIYKDILASGVGDYQAVTTAAAARIDPRFGTWSDLLGTWMVANVLGQPTGFNGYKGAISVASPSSGAWSSDILLNDWLFSPGEGIISSISASGTFTPPAGSGLHIVYSGIDTVSGAVDTISPFAGNVSLVYNANPYVDGPDETGYVANVVDPSLASRVLRTVLPVDPLPTRYPIDVLLAPEGGDPSAIGATVNAFTDKRETGK